MVFSAICQLFSCYFLFVFRTFGKQVRIRKTCIVRKYSPGMKYWVLSRPSSNMDPTCLV